MSTWKRPHVTDHYLTGVRGAIPLATEQIDLMLRLLGAAVPDVERFLDLGCGDGVLGEAIFSAYPHAQGVLIDFSEPMIESARKRFEQSSYSVEIIQQDYSDPVWPDSITQFKSFDVAVSGFSIHHLPDERKRVLYGEIYELLRPGGIFLNLEHVASRSRWEAEIFDGLFIDALFDYQQQTGTEKTRDKVAREYHRRADQEDNILALVEVQCDWLREIGFERVDCYLKILELALFGGIKPD